jgi:two-component system sensor histidine kinase PilS (NtrC family)
MDALTRSDAVPDSFWRSLAFFSLYRLTVGGLFLFAVLMYGDTLNLATQDGRLFVRTDVSYILAATVFLALIWRRQPNFHLQLSIQVAADVAFLTLLMYASGGQKSGIAVLLLVVVAGAGLVGQGRMTLFYAALASVALLLEESWRALTLEADLAEFFRTGLTCVGFFGTAITARLLARRVVSNEQLAQRRGAELDRQLRINARIIRDMSDGVLVTDADGQVRQANPAADRLLSLSLTGGRLADVSTELMAHYLRWNSTRQENDTIFRAPNGRPLRIRYLPAEDHSGNALLYLQDMDQVQAQAQQLKLAALGRLTANIAHEIRNPLAAISHAAELLAEEDPDPLRTRLARIVGDNSARLNRLVTDVLELGRRDRAEPETLHWQAFARTLVEELSLHDPTAQTRIRISGDDLGFLFDRGHLHRVLWNLITNALRHASMAEGAITLDALAVAGTNQVALYVRNDGPGIDPSLRGQIFEPFFTTRSAGTGLGLYIGRELCEANGAVLDLLDNVPGTQFRIVMKGTQ